MAFFVWGMAVGMLVMNRQERWGPMTRGHRVGLGAGLTLALLVAWLGWKSPGVEENPCARLSEVCERAPELCVELMAACAE